MRALLSILILIASVPSASAAEPDYSAFSDEELIDAFVLIDAEGPGLHGTATYEGFVATDGDLRLSTGVVGSDAPVIHPQLRELVVRGADALPELLAHLTDERPTGLATGDDGSTSGGLFAVMGGTLSGREYAPRNPLESREGLNCGIDCPDDDGVGSSYTLKVGDICYVIIGQIVNRELNAIRYQPTAITVVNSPVLVPELAEWARDDWAGLTAAEHEASLISDMRIGLISDDFSPALARLRFYFPDSYAALEGDDLRKRQEFEFEELEAQLQRAALPYNDRPTRAPLDQALAGCAPLESCLAIVDAYLDDLEFTSPLPDYAAVAAVLGRYGNAAKEELFERATGWNPARRYLAGWILSEWQALERDDMGTLIEMLRLDPGGPAARAIVRADPVGAPEILAMDIARFGQETESTAMLIRIGAPALPYLFPYLSDDHSCGHASFVISEMGARALVGRAEFERIALDEGESDARRIAAVRGLGVIGPSDPGIAGVLEELANGGNARVAAEAGFAIQKALDVNLVYFGEPCAALR